MRPSLTSHLSPNFNRLPDRTAIESEADRLSYRELGDRIAGAAAWLDAARLGGQRLALFCPNSWHFPVAVHAILEAGSSALLLNPANAPAELAEQIADADVRTVLTLASLADRLPPGLDLVPIDGWPAGALTEESPRSAERGPKPLDDEAAIIFTSGMSGRTRGAVLTHGSLGANADAVVEALELVADDRVIGALPWAHAFGFTVCLNAALSAGATLLPVPRFHPATLLDLLEGGEATVLAGVPAMFGAILGMAARRGSPKHRLRLAICGGAPLNQMLARQWESAFGLPLRQGYGLTEASPVCLFNAPSRPNRIGTLGQPLPGVAVTIRDAAGTELGEREVGEICVQGPNVFSGYLDEPQSPKVLRTGDLGMCDDGYIRFQGTIKPMFTRSGFNIYPREISRALEEDARIDRAEVFARPDAARENEIVLEIHARDGLDAEAVKQICQQRLASYKQPSEIRIISTSTPQSR